MLCIATLGYAQIVADLGTGAAGTLGTKVPEGDRATLTSLTVKGEMDARDFMFIKEHLPALETLDLQNANIVYYEGEGGTMGGSNSNYYEANHIPAYAFKDNTSITKIVFPKSLIAVDYLCFYNTQLTEIDFSNTNLETIVNSAISANYKLTSVSLPVTLKEVGDCGLSYNYYLTSVKVAMADPSSVNAELMFGKSQKWDPEKQEYVKDEQGNPIWVENTPPANCVLYVPAGKTEAYKAIKPWSLFTTTEENADAPVLPTPELKFEKSAMTAKVGDAPFKNTLTNPANVTVTYTSSDEKVASVDAEGLITVLAQGVTTITATSKATAEYSEATASFLLTVESAEVVPGNTVDMGIGAAGTLEAKIPESDRATLTSLTIKGEIDVRDFKFLRDQLPALETLDLLHAKIAFYQGADGTMNGDNYYEEGVLPAYAFQNNTSVTKVVFPNSLTGIGYCAINNSSLKEIDLSQTQVATVAGSGLAQNNSLNAVSLPATLKKIENYGLAFNTQMTSLKVAVQDPTQLDATLMLGVRYKYDNENHQYVTDENGNLVIESEEVPPTACVLYVPVGKVDAYKALKPWSLFTEIKEIVTGDPSKKNPELNFEKAAVTAKVGDAPFKNTLNNPENVVVAYTSSDEAVATVDAEGMITVLAPGISTITVTSEATEIYNEATASFQLTVKGNATYKDGIAEMGTGAAGTLSTLIPQEEMDVLTELTIIGEIDARDFKFLRDQLSALEKLDLKDAVIVAYTGADGSYEYGDETTEYEPNHLPSNAFYSNTSLLEIVFPTSLSVIDYLALSNTQLTVLDFSNTQLRVLDSSSVERNAMLTSVVFPSTLKFAAERSLANNPALTSFTCHVADPKDITDGIRGMFGIEYKRDPVTGEYIEENGEYIVESITTAPEGCVLYVPEASVELYKADADWSDLFTSIVAIGTVAIDKEVARMPLQVTQGGLCVNADAAMLRVYDVAGQLVYQQKVEGEAQIALRSGLYIIQLGGKAQRVVIP